MRNDGALKAESMEAALEKLEDILRPASMTITITEDVDPDGHVNIDHEIHGFDINAAKTNDDLPPALQVGAEMLRSI